MSDGVDIGREAVELRAKTIELSWPDDARLFRALRAALDAAEAERDRLRAELADVLAENDAARFQLNNALAALRETGHE